MYLTRGRTGFVGFLVAIKSTKEMFHDLVHVPRVPKAPVKYMQMYKFSQDHLELFFGAVWSAGGFSNNPTSLVRSFTDSPKITSLIEYKKVDIFYIAGYVA